MTLGFSFGDVAAWVFIFWLCIDCYLNDWIREVYMNAIIKIGMAVLAVLRGL